MYEISHYCLHFGLDDLRISQTVLCPIVKWIGWNREHVFKERDDVMLPIGYGRSQRHPWIIKNHFHSLHSSKRPALELGIE